MKLPFSFGSRPFNRIVLPGTLAAMGLLPLVVTCLKAIGIDLSLATVFPAVALASGWMLSLAEMPIYMLYEGRRWWPRRIHAWKVLHQQRKVDGWLKRADGLKAKGAESLATEYTIKAYRYPIDGGEYPPRSGQPKATAPTEFGNVIFGYETYPTVKYGVDGNFFWDRIWMLLDKDTREALDEEQALCDGVIYASFACGLCVIAFLSYWALEVTTDFTMFGFRRPALLPGIAVFFLVLSVFFYKIAIILNYRFGERVKAMFDTNLDKLGVQRALIVIGKKTGANLVDTSDPDTIMAAWRYLRWHMFKRTPTDASVDIETVKPTEGARD